jgi:hypothetical protein
VRLPLALIALLVLAGCGGGGGGTADVPAAPVTIDIPVDAPRSGWITSGGGLGVNLAPISGDLPDNTEQRGFFSFGIGTIPGTATLQTVVLRVYQTGTAGTPYTDFTALSVDSVDMGAALDAGDFLVPALSTPGTLTPFDATIGIKTLSVLAQVAADRTAARSFSSFRLSFLGAPGADSANDRALFGVFGPGAETFLRVTYQP